MTLELTRLDIPEVIVAQSTVYADDRGFFNEIYKRSEFARALLAYTFVQDNHSRSVRGVLRGLHYQKNPTAQAKLISVIRGEILDVVVDIRQGSPTYGKWLSVVLSDRNHRILFVPEGLAHGFLTLSDEADVIYKVSSEYSPEHERGIVWNDPALGIDWPIQDPLLSPKDRGLPALKDADNNFRYKG